MTCVGGIEVLSQPLREELKKHIGPNETILRCVAPRSTKATIGEHLLGSRELMANWLDGMVVLEKRLITLRGDPSLIGITVTVNSKEFLDIRHIHVQEDKSLGYIELRVDDFILSLPKRAESEIRNFAEWLREKVRDARLPLQVQQHTSSDRSLDIADKLEKLRELRKEGVLTEEEFEVAKKRLLS